MKRQPTPIPTESQLMCVRTASDVLKDWSSNLCVPTCAPHFLLKSILLFPTWNLEPTSVIVLLDDWLVSLGCCHRGRGPGWLHTTEVSQFWSIEVWNQGVSGAALPLKSPETDYSSPLTGVSGLWLPLQTSSDTGVLPANLTSSFFCVHTFALLIRIPVMSG